MNLVEHLTLTVFTGHDILVWSLSHPLRHAPISRLQSGVQPSAFSRERYSGGDLVTHPSQFWWEKHPPSVVFLWFFLFSHSRSLALSSHTASVTTEGFSLQGTLAYYCCWVGLNETHSKDVFAVALRAIPATWRSLWLLFFEAWSACLSNLEIKPGARSMPGSWRERPGEDGLHLSGERWCK